MLLKKAAASTMKNRKRQFFKTEAPDVPGGLFPLVRERLLDFLSGHMPRGSGPEVLFACHVPAPGKGDAFYFTDNLWKCTIPE